MSLKKIAPTEFTCNPVDLFAKPGALVTAGSCDGFNTMTIGWGGIGELWARAVATVYVRPSRYTYEFMEKSEYYTIGFFGEEMSETLVFCGTKSGRDVDKVAATGLTPLVHETGAVYFGEAKLVLVCKKLWRTDLRTEDFVTDEIPNNYNGLDYHRIYVGEIVDTLRAE